MSGALAVEEGPFGGDLTGGVGDHIEGNPVVDSGVADDLPVLLHRLALGPEPGAGGVTPLESDRRRAEHEADGLVDHAGGDEATVDGHRADDLGVAGDVDLDELDGRRLGDGSDHGITLGQGDDRHPARAEQQHGVSGEEHALHHEVADLEPSDLPRAAGR